MSNYPPPPPPPGAPYGNSQTYTTYAQSAGYPPQPQPPPQYAPPYPQFPPYQQAPPSYYRAPTVPPTHGGPHAGYTPTNPTAPPAPGARGLEYPSFSAPMPPAPHLKYPPVPPADNPQQQQPQQQPQPPPQGTPAAPIYWQQHRQMPDGTRQFSEPDARSAAHATFDRFDIDRSGYLDLQEFMDALRALHLAITYHEAMDCFVKCDANEDGRIGKEEFVNVYINEMKNRESRLPGPGY